MDPINPDDKNPKIDISPSLELAENSSRIYPRRRSMDLRIAYIAGLAMVVAVAAALIAQGLIRLIGFITNIAFYGQASSAFVSPAHNHLGAWVLAIPVIGGLIVGVMARFGSAAIRGHGIPEAMEQVLTNQSRIPPRVTFLKPISAAISIGTGGPFGAEGPIIATGGALGSLVGQLLKMTADERKTLLAAGAAAGMTATFGSPVSAVLLAIELLLFEFRASSFIPVALASTVATGVRMAFVGSAAMFSMPGVAAPGGAALAFYILMGAIVGVASVIVTKAVYVVEDLFDRLPVHWMWWPAIGAVAVGIIGYFSPHTLGVGYDNIERVLSGELAGRAVLALCLFKFVSWAISLGSGTSGGTLAPLFTIGGGLGAWLGQTASRWFPQLGIDARVAALVGMSALFAGASRALLASVVFAFETTMQPLGLLPLLGGCAAAYLVSSFLMRHTIMTEKIARRGVVVPSEYGADVLAHTLVGDVFTRGCAILRATDRLCAVREWIASGVVESRHQGFPVVDEDEHLVGVLTHREVMDLTAGSDQPLRELIKRQPVVIFPDQTLRDAADLMIQEEVGRLPVVARANPRNVVGILSRSDLLSAHGPQLRNRHERQDPIQLRRRG